MADISRRLQYFLERAGLSAQQLADKVKVTPSAVSLWLNGKAQPRYDRLPDIVGALGIDMPTFWGEVPASDDPSSTGGGEGKDASAAS